MPIDLLTTAKGVGIAAEQIPWLQRFWRWWKSRRYPKPPLHHYGIVVAIATENDAQRAQLKSDFIETLRGQLKQHSNLTVLELQENLSKKIDIERDAGYVLEKTESVFLVAGTLRRRNFNGRDTFVLDLKPAVRHRPIDKETQNRLAQEMREVLPGRRLIAANNDLIEFELNAVTMDLASRHIIAVAAYLSNQRALALDLWQSLNTYLDATNTSVFNTETKNLFETLKNKVVQNIIAYYLDEAVVSQYEWRLSRDKKHLETMVRNLDAVETYSPNLYQVAVLRALYIFVITRNVREARQLLVRYSGEGDATWSFDMAFFYAYEGHLTQATGYYKKAFAQNPESRIIVEVEEWLLWVLSDEPDKAQLHYCLGLLNYYGKGDAVKAKQDFERFLASSEGKFSKERQKVEKYLEQISRDESTKLLWE